MTAGTISKVAKGEREIGGKRAAKIGVERLAIAANEKINGHRCSHQDDEGLDPGLGEPLRKVGAGISAEQRAGGHGNGLRPDDRAHNDESDGGNAVDDAAENHLELIHGVNVGHAERGKHGQIHNAYAAAEVAAVNGDEQLEEGRPGNRRGGGVMRDARGNPSGQMFAEGKEQCGAEHQPRKHAQEGLCGGLDEEKCAGQAAENAGEDQRHHHTPPNIQLLGISAAAHGSAHPERESVSGVGTHSKGEVREGFKGRARDVRCAAASLQGAVDQRRTVSTRSEFIGGRMASRADTIPMGGSSPSGIWGVILASSVGTMIEWYDFYIFGSLAAVLSLKFYPPGNATFAYIAYLATFAVGFMVRPFGALFFGRIGDLVGRKYAFLVTLTVMGFGTFLIGLMPTFATAGWLAPISLILIRVFQGLALGGEYGGAAIYVAEHVPDNKRGYWTSYIQITATLGLFLSVITVILLQFYMTPANFQSYGWRIPFLVSVILVMISLYIRLKMKESPIFSQIKSTGMSSAKPLKEIGRAHV